jgi:hypothetical protein
MTKIAKCATFRSVDEECLCVPSGSNVQITGGSTKSSVMINQTNSHLELVKTGVALRRFQRHYRSYEESSINRDKIAKIILSKATKVRGERPA